MPTLRDLADRIYCPQLRRTSGVHVTIYLFALGRRSGWQYACTCSAPGWGHYGVDRRDGEEAHPTEYSAIAAALMTLRAHWRTHGVEAIATDIDAALESLWL